MGKKKGGMTGTPTVEYHISTHLGYCLGPVDAIHRVMFRDKWIATNVYRTAVDRIAIDERELFGGPKKEGGIHGALWFLPGHDDQVMPEELARKFTGGVGGSDTVPGFRGVATIALVGNGWNNQPGFYQGSQLPQVNIPEVELSRGAYRLGTPYTFPPAASDGSFKWKNVNAAAAIYEMLVDDDWGMGASEFSFNKDSFLLAAETLYNENFGITIYQGQQTKIEDLISDTLDHIDGMFFFNPRTGLGELKLLRDDYNVEDLETIGPENARMVSFRRKLWGETTNEIIVEWVNPESEENETVTYQNLANIAMQGEVVSETKQYHFVRDGDLASTLAARDIARASQPLATCVLEVNRTSWKYLPGDVVKLTWPKYDIENLVMRVMEVDFGTVAQARIRVTLLEDIFGLSYAKYIEAPKTEWEEPGTPPEPLEVMALSTPKPIIDMFYTLTDDMYPDITPALLAWSPAYDVNTFELWSWTTGVSGEMDWTSIGIRSTIGKTSNIADMVQEVTTDLEIAQTVGGLSPAPSAVGVISDNDDYGHEFVLFTKDVSSDYPGTSNKVWRVTRGLWDTIPQNWPAGTPIRILTTAFNAMDFAENLAFTDKDYKLQTISSKAKLAFDDTPTVTVNLCDRPHLPFRPANVQVDGVMFGTLDYSGDTGDRRTHVNVTWANRNRNLEDAVARHWDDLDMDVEDGQTTEIVYLDMSMNEISRVTGLTGTSYSLPLSGFTVGGEDEGYVKVVSRRDGLESLQGMTIHIKFQPRGFGHDYGMGYGGWIGWEGVESE